MDFSDSRDNVTEAIEEFHRANILPTKEEGDTPHATRSYDQQGANSDNLETHNLIDIVCNYVK